MAFWFTGDVLDWEAFVVTQNEKYFFLIIHGGHREYELADTFE